MSKTKNTFKDTLNLPKTSFPMRANLAQNEPQSIKRWDKETLYENVVAARKNAPSFRFHDGPPYANGHIHMGHLLNKVLKDMVVRSQTMQGKHCPYTPGWDCHGLPIEHRVLSELSKEKLEKLASLDDNIRRMAIRNECAKYAQKFVKLQKEDMKRLLTTADYDNPYLTMTPQFEARVLNVFADLMAEGIVYRQLKPVHWSIANQTALADAELEYADKIDTSVYVGFDCLDPDAIKSAFNISDNISPAFMIWTTTPWTLPANLAVALHHDYSYALVQFTPHGKPYVVAKDLIDSIASHIEGSEPTLLGTVKGSELVGLQYQHPFCDRTGTVYHADYVTLEDGSGLVHTAPGHGEEDYQTSLREGLDIYCPVQADGTYDDTVPEWIQGQLIWDANSKIVDHLRSSGHLFFAHDFSHSYPHDWRSKTPVIFRSTEQWFIGVDKPMKSTNTSIRDAGLAAVKTTLEFTPDWGKKRLGGMLESRPDWCISRQRSWGLPIPAFCCEDGSIFMTEASIRAVAKRFSDVGSDAWFKETPAELLANYDPSTDPDTPRGFTMDKLTKLHDIFDVWFESGSSWQAVFDLKSDQTPIDLYLEGSDQHRGWFQLSLLLSLGSFKQPAFKRLLTHGFIVDKEGKKMSKSLGNTLDVGDLMKNYGADVCRWWVSSLSYENDIKVDTAYLDVASETYRKIRNTLRFLLSNLSDYTGVHDYSCEFVHDYVKNLDPKTPEAYILSELSFLQSTCINNYNIYAFRDLHQDIYTFCSHTLSSVYCSLVKDRLYCDSPDSDRRRRSQVALHIILEVLCRLLAPLIPHTADETYASLHGNQDQSIHEETFFTLDVTCAPEWATIMAERPTILKALEEAKANGLDNMLDCGLALSDPTGTYSTFSEDLADLFGVSQVSLVTEPDILKVIDLRDQPRCERSWKRDSTVSERDNGVLLSTRDWEAINNV